MNVCSLIFILLCLAGHLRYGLSSNEVERIINGSDTNIIKAPFMVSLRLYDEHICGGAIVSLNWVVTAAHCMKVKCKNPLKDITISSGSSILYENCIIHNIVNFKTHENYNREINDYDIAVVQVTPAFAYNAHTQAVDLAPNRFIHRNLGIVCGWGYYLKFSDIIEPFPSTKLQCAEVPHISKWICQRDYADKYILTPRMTCYGFQDGGTDACQGDSGGPIVNSEKVLLGITSWGDGCADRNSPGVYTDCVFLRDWIRNNTGMRCLKNLS